MAELGAHSPLTGKKIDSAFVQQAVGFCEEMIAKGHQVKTRVLKLQIEPAYVQVARQLGIRVNEEVVCLDRLSNPGLLRAWRSH